MFGRVLVYRLALLCLCAVALGHGFAGAATHVPHHPVPVAMAEAFSAPAGDGGESHDDGHTGASCEIVTGAGPGSFHPAAGVPVCPLRTEPFVSSLPSGESTPSRSPPEPSPVVLSVLRI